MILHGEKNDKDTTAETADTFDLRYRLDDGLVGRGHLHHGGSLLVGGSGGTVTDDEAAMDVGCGRKKRHRQKKRDQVGIGGPLTDHSATKSNSKLQTSKHFRHLPAPWWGERDDLIIAPYQWQMQCPSGSMLAKATKHRLIQDTRADQGGRMMMMMRDCNIVGWSGTAAIGQ